MSTDTRERKSFSEKKTELFKRGVTPATVYIGNLQYSKDEEYITDMFKRFGNINFVNITKDPKTKKSRGFAFVRMYNIKDAEKAIKFYNGKVFDGRTLKASIAIENDEAKPVKFYSDKKKDIEEEPEIEHVKSRRSSPSKKQGLGVLFNYLEK